MSQLHTNAFDQKLQRLLALPELVPYLKEDVLFNGLQLRANANVQRVGFGVSASMDLFKIAKKQRCDTVIVHHGLIGDERWLDRMTQERVMFLVRNNISLFSFHFLLDAHPVLGHAAQILQQIGVKKTVAFDFQGAPWGRRGDLEKLATLSTIWKKLQPFCSPTTTIYDVGPQKIRRVACVSGKGGPYSQELPAIKDQGIDLYITGEVSEWHRESFREAGMHFIAGGHYHTESFGLRALQNVVQKKWGIATTWLDLPNNV